VRCAHDAPEDVLTESYPEAEYYEDLLRVTAGRTREPLARMVLAESRGMRPWMRRHGVVFQPSLGGTLHLSRTNAFFLGGGKALVNAYYRSAARLGVEVRYDAEVLDVEIVEGRFRAAIVKEGGSTRRIEAKAMVAAAGGFESNLEWLREAWGPRADNFVVRGTAFNKGVLLKAMIARGLQPIGDPIQGHAVAVDGRSPKFDGGIVTRLDSVPLGIVVNRDGQRFYDEGEDFWPKRYAVWGRFVADQPGQVAYSIVDAKAMGRFMPPVFTGQKSDTIEGLARELGLDPAALGRTVRALMPPCGRETSTTRASTIAAPRDCSRRRPTGRAPSTRRPSWAIRYVPASRSPIWGSRSTPKRASAMRGAGAPQSFLCGRDDGGQRARARLSRRHRHDDRHGVRAHRRGGRGGRGEGKRMTRVAELVTQAAGEADRLYAEGARIMQICNACRYCEGYCAVFPAMEKRLEFDRASLDYLSNLCHHCGACFYACQYAPPHEFAVNVPKVFAQVRRQSYEEYAWPRAFGAAYRRQGAALSLALAASLAAFFALATTLSGKPAGSFYAVFPHGLLVTVFGIVFLFALLAMTIGALRFRKATSGTDHRDPLYGTSGLSPSLTLENLKGGGEGCYVRAGFDHPPERMRRWFHHFTFYGFLLCFASTSLATIYHYGFGLPAPYALTSPVVLLGTIGGVGLVVGPAGLLWLRRRHDPVLREESHVWLDAGFTWLLLATSATGIALLACRDTGRCRCCSRSTWAWYSRSSSRCPTESLCMACIGTLP
jgi:precorrin 3B synthase CobZ